MKSTLIEPLEARITPAALFILPSSISEGDTGLTTLTFTIRLDSAATGPVNVDFATEDGTAIVGGNAATGGQDYVARTGTVSFAAGELEKSIQISVNGDLVGEDDEAFTVRLSNPVGATIGGETAAGTIRNDAKLSIDDRSLLEGDAGTQDMVFTVSVTEAPLTQTLSVNYATENASAIAGSDYTAKNGTLTFAPGVLSQTLSVSINGDTNAEANEDFNVRLTNQVPLSTVLQDNLGKGTILNDPKFQISSVSRQEGDSGETDFVFTVSLTERTPGDTATYSVSFATVDGTALAGNDYIAQAITNLQFTPETSTQSVTVKVLGDLVGEVDETFFVQLSGATGVPIKEGGDRATGTIQNDARLRIGDARIVEGNDGTKLMVFDVTLIEKAPGNVTVNYATSDGTGNNAARAIEDYVAQTGSLTFGEGETTKQVSIVVNGDTRAEGLSEQFVVTLSSPVNARLDDQTGVGTIQDDDALTVGDLEVVEGDTDTTVFFTVSLKNLNIPAGQVLKVKYITQDGSGVPSDAAATSTGPVPDYIGIAQPTNPTDAAIELIFSPGETTKTVPVTIKGDETFERAQERFSLLLTEAAFYTSGPNGTKVGENLPIADPRGVATILQSADGDAVPTISVLDTKKVEGASGQSLMQFTVQLSAPVGYDTRIVYSTEGIAGSATAGEDYTPVSNGLLVIPAGQATGTIQIAISGDTVDELDETFALVLNEAKLVGGNLPAEGQPLTVTDNRAVGTIQNDERSVSIALDGSTGQENSGTIRFKVTLSSASSAQVVVSFKTEDITAISTGTFADYTAQTSTVTFAPGHTEAFIDVAIIDDTRFEGDETFKVTLTDVQNAAVGTTPGNSAQATIRDNDNPPTVSVVQDGVATEGGPVKFKVTLSAPLQEAITIPYSFTLGTAQSTDFVSTGGSVTIAAGQTTADIIVNTVNDTINEPDETFTITLEDRPNTGGAVSATGTITDDGDALPRVSIGDLSIVEGDTGQKVAEFIVTLSAVSGKDVTITYQLFDRTAVGGVDYVIPTTTTLVIPAGQTSGKILVPIIGDELTEPTEEFIVRLGSATNALIQDNEGVGAILDDEREFSIRFDGETETPHTITVDEPANGTASKVVTFRVVRTGDLSQPASVQYTTADGVDRTGARAAVSAGARKDFAALSGTATFAAGAAESAPIELTINGDNVHEGLEEFFIRLQNGVNGSPAPVGGTGTVQITDNDAAPTVTVSSPTALEANLSNNVATKTDLVFKVTLSNPTEIGAVTLKYATANGETVFGPDNVIVTAGATAGTTRADYEALSITNLTFAAGETTKDVIVRVLGDVRDEYDETLKLNLTDLNANATFGGGGTTLSGTGTITDNDLAPTVSISDLSSGSGSTLTGATYLESDGLTTSKFFRVTLSAETEKEVRVGYTTANGTATAGQDFLQNSGALIFAPANGNTAGQTTKDITINVLEDSAAENAEKFEVRLNDGVVGAVTLDGVGEATIQDNDKAIFTINDVTMVEGNDPNTPQVARFLVSLANTTERSVTISYSTVDGTAKVSGAFADYLFTSGTLTFDAANTSAFIDVPIIGDTYKEAVEAFTVRLSGGSEAQFAKADGIANIQNGDDASIGVAIDDVRVVEGTPGVSTAGKAQFRVITSGPLESGQTVTVKATTRDGLAMAGSDYTAKTGTLTFSGSTVSQLFEVNVTGDTRFEGAENFFVDLSDATITPTTSTVAIERATGGAIIYNDDVQQVNARTVQWIDVDGDVVTLKVNKGALNISDINDFDFINQITGTSGNTPLSTVGGLALRALNLQNDGNEFKRANISITAEPQAIFDPNGTVFLGDGRVDIGWINAGLFTSDNSNFFGVDLGTVTVDGGLARITAGDRTISSSSMGRLNVEHLGVDSAQVGVDNTLSYFQGAVGKLQVAGDLEGQVQVAAAQFGRIGSITVGGTLGGEAAQAGLILFSGKLGRATFGAIDGGAGANSGSLRGETTFPTARIGSVTVLGDIIGGAGEESGVINAPRIGKVTVLGSVIGGSGKQSGTVGGTPVDAGDLITSSIKSIKVAGAVEGGTGDFSGALSARSINSVSVGSVSGGGGDLSGAIRAGVLGKVNITGDVVGGTGADSGIILADSTIPSNGVVKMNSVQIGGRLVGGEGANSGVVASDASAQSIVIKGTVTPDSAAAPGVSAAVIGGTGTQSGRISVNFGLGQLVLGTPQSGSSGGTEYSILGGSGADSGYIVLGAVKAVALNGDVQGGSHNNTGGLNVAGRVSTFTLNGSLLGGDSVAATPFSNGRAVNNSGFLSAGQIGKALVTGDIISGQDSGAGLNGSGLIAAAGGSVAGTIGKLEIAGKIQGNESESVLIAALGTRGKLAIGKLTVGGNVDFLEILAGLAKPGADGKLPRNADASLGDLIFEGDVRALDIASGAAKGTDGRFGTPDDEIFTAASSEYLNELGVYSRIASVIIKGSVLAGPVSGDAPLRYGIVAQEIGSIVVGGTRVPLIPGAINDRTPLEVSAGTGLFALELPVTNPAPPA